MKMRTYPLIPLLMLAACAKPGSAPKQADATAAGSGDVAPPPFHVAVPLKQFMAQVMQLTGDGIWKRQGYVTEGAGTKSLFPKNDAEWKEAEGASLALAEMTNVLLIPGRRVPEAEWDKAAIGVRTVALKAADAARRKSEDAFFEAGGELDEACDVCHRRYDPSFSK